MQIGDHSSLLFKNWHTTFCFRCTDIMIWYRDILQNYHHNHTSPSLHITTISLLQWGHSRPAVLAAFRHIIQQYLLAITVVLCIRSPELSSFNWKFVPSTDVSPFPHFSPPCFPQNNVLPAWEITVKGDFLNHQSLWREMWWMEPTSLPWGQSTWEVLGRYRKQGYLTCLSPEAAWSCQFPEKNCGSVSEPDRTGL